MAVPSVTWGDRGFIAPSGPAVLAGVQGDISAAFGRNLNYQLTTPQGQIASSEAAVIIDTNSIFVYYTNQVDPAYATGRMQDAIARIYFLTRKPAEPTVLQLQLSGQLGVVIPIGASVIDAAGNIYLSVESGTIPSSGLLSLPFACQQVGPTAVPDEVGVYQAIPGWDSATILSGTVGQNTESRSQFETRRRQSVAHNAVGILDAVLGAVLGVSGVLDAYVTENDLSTPVTRGGYQLAANSIYVAVVGGSPDDVARAIWSKKAPGCTYNGNTTVQVEDNNAAYSPPRPTYQVRYETPASLPVLYEVVISDGPTVPADAGTQIQDIILAAFNGEDGGERARIGSTIYATRYVPAVLALGSWVQLQSLRIGSSNNPNASFVGQIAANLLTVTSIASGALGVGQTVFSAEVGDVTTDTVILSQETGFPGGIGTYTVSQSQTVGSGPMTSVIAAANSVVVEIDQVPTLTRDNIHVTVVQP